MLRLGWEKVVMNMETVAEKCIDWRWWGVPLCVVYAGYVALSVATSPARHKHSI